MSASRHSEGSGNSEGERLNLEAYKALAGLYPQSDGESRLAELLRSSVKIDPYVRDALANALSPNGEKYTGVRLQLAGLGAGDFARKMRTKGKMLRVGRQALQLIGSGTSRAQAEAAIAEREKRSSESVKKAVDYARRFSAYEDKQKVGDTDTQQSRIARELLFHVAAIQESDPTDFATKWYAFLDDLDRKEESD